jgi:FkbM family methyltransferase
MEPTPRDDEIRIQQVYELILREGDLALDVGAHAGRHCIPMANQVFPTGRVYAFEPLPVCRANLAEEVSRCYPELADLLTILPYAVGAQTGEADFYVARDDLPYSGLRPRVYLGPTRLARLPVQVKRLDDLFLSLPSLRFIKLDVEGGEYHVLKGAVGCLRKFRPVVVFEFGDFAIAEYGITSADMARFWAEENYHVYGIHGSQLSPEEFLASSREQAIHDYVALPAEDTELQRRVVAALTEPSPVWQRIVLNLGQAERFAVIGTEVPPMTQYRGPLRWLARWTARAVLFLAQVVTRRQRAFNRSMLLGARAQLYALREADSRLTALESLWREERERWQVELAGRDARIGELEQALADPRVRPRSSVDRVA